MELQLLVTALMANIGWPVEVVVLADHQSILDQITPHLMKQVTAVLVLFQTLLERLHIMVAVAVAALLIGLTQEQLGA